MRDRATIKKALMCMSGDELLDYLEDAEKAADRIEQLQQQVDAILVTEIDWHDGPLTVRDLGAVQKTLAAINNDQP